MRGALARHPRLNADLAESLYGWVGETLRAAIAERFTIDPAKLAASVSESGDRDDPRRRCGEPRNPLCFTAAAERGLREQVHDGAAG